MVRFPDCDASGARTARQRAIGTMASRRREVARRYSIGSDFRVRVLARAANPLRSLMPTTTSIEEAARLLSAEAAPVLFLDACALLDILRVASDRDDAAPARVILAANQILEGVNSRPRTLWLLAAALVEVEWGDNVEKV